MKRLNIRKTVIGILAAAVIMLLFSACSGVIGGDYNVRISVPQLASGSGRYISGSANSGYVVVLKENKVYSLNSFSDKAYQEFENGNVYIANLPVGDYIFGIVLLDDQGTTDTGDDVNVGLAIKKREIKEGFNDIEIDVGPGINAFTINTVSFEDFFTPDGYTSTFAEDTIILDIDRNPGGDDFILTFNTGVVASVQSISDYLNLGGGVGSPTWGGTLPANQDGADVTISGAPLTHPYTLKVILK